MPSLLKVIRYALRLNRLTSAPDDYMAVVQDQPVVTKDDLIDDIVSRGGNVNRAEALASHEEDEAAVVRALEAGAIVSTPLYHISASIQGVFENEDSPFDPSIHVVKLNIRPGSRLEEIAKNIRVQRVEGAVIEPVIKSVYDWGSDSETTLTSGGVFEINGSDLKIQDNLTSEGVFFIKQSDNTATQAVRVRTNRPSQLVVLVPTLTAGNYRVEVRNTYRSGSTLKTGLFRHFTYRIMTDSHPISLLQSLHQGLCSRCIKGFAVAASRALQPLHQGLCSHCIKALQPLHQGFAAIATG